MEKWSNGKMGQACTVKNDNRKFEKNKEICLQDLLLESKALLSSSIFLTNPLDFPKIQTVV